MGDVGEVFNEWKAYKKERKQRLGMPCPDCTVRLPKAQSKILMPNQKCWCGYVDKRARGEQALAQLKQDGDCKKCKDGCPACDARKLQKEAHDLL